jgi:exopolyphosphatase/guanosine-5'-triphosphate,3'-diphosphate pyrophosphatase
VTGAVAAIDIGTNSVLLLIAERRGNQLVALLERATVTRLGQGVDAAHALAPEAVHRTLECLRRYADEIRAAGASRVTAVGTSALRDAAGVDAFLERATEILGVSPRVITGAEEARLAFTGALTGLALPEGPVLVADIGGGSTEIIAGDVRSKSSSPEMLWSASLDVGSVRLTERYIKSDPIQATELDAVRAETQKALARLSITHASDGETDRRGSAPPPLASSLEGGGYVVGVAGTVTTLAALASGLTSLTAPEPVPSEARGTSGARGAAAASASTPTHGIRLTRHEVGALIKRLARLPLRERKALPGLDEARADIIVAGSAIVEEVLTWAGADVLITSDRGVRWGLAEALATAQEPV